MAINEPSGMSFGQKFHLILSIVLAVTILFLYYSFMTSIPMPPHHWLNWFWSLFYLELHFNSMGIFLNIPIIYSAITLGWKRFLIFFLILLSSITPYVLHFSFSGSTLFLSLAMLILPSIIIICTKLWLESHTREKKARIERENLRITALRQKFKLQEDERKHLAQELHDGVIQTSLINASIVRELFITHTQKTPEAMEKDLSLVEKNCIDIADDIRNICKNLRPSILDNLGLMPAVRWMSDHIHEETGLKIILSVTGSFEKLTPDENGVFFRIIQETLNNIRRHAQADTVNINMQSIDSKISIEISDNGTGFKLPENVNNLAKIGKLGIIGMYERAQSIGATLLIKPEMGSGTTILVSLDKNPLNTFQNQSAILNKA